MKKTPPLIKRAGLTGSTVTLGICLSASIFTNALAGPGNGKGGGNNQVPPPVPFTYRVTWIDTENPNDVLYLRDVAPDGTVVGAILPGGVYASNIAVVSFPDGSLLDVQEMLHTANLADEEDGIPATWRATYAYRICDNGLIAVDIYDDAGRMYSGALQLTSEGNFGSFRLFGDPYPAGRDAILMDASESGEFLIATGEFTDGVGTGIRFAGPADLHVWTPLDGTANGTSFELASQVPGGQEGWWNETAISDYPAAIYPDAILGESFFAYDAVNPTPTELLDPLDPGTVLTLRDVSADGTVVAQIDGAQIRRNKFAPDSIARWSPTSGTWDPIFTGGGDAFINATGEITISSGGDLHVFQDAFDGTIGVNDMIDPSQESDWVESNSRQLLGLSNKATSDTPGGVILGRDVTAQRNFILTPLAPQ